MHGHSREECFHGAEVSGQVFFVLCVRLALSPEQTALPGTQSETAPGLNPGANPEPACQMLNGLAHSTDCKTNKKCVCAYEKQQSSPSIDNAI